MSTINFNGDIYNYGENVEHITTEYITPHIYYDGSKKYDVAYKIFEEIGVSSSIFLGESEDDVYNYYDIMSEILKYLNLHIIQIGYDFYIFDWSTLRENNNVTWTDIFTGDTSNESISSITIGKTDVSSTDTNITIDDVYNQVQVECKLDEYSTIIESPLDDDSLYSDYGGWQWYMREYASPGDGSSAAQVFLDMILGKQTADAHTSEEAYSKDWYFQVMKNDKWSFKLNGVDNYSVCQQDANGKYYNQWQMMKYLQETPFASAIISFGSTDKFNTYNQTNTMNVDSFKHALVLTIHGNGSDGEHHNHLNDDIIYPSDNDLRNANISIEYNDPTNGIYSSADPNTVNYLIFSGNFIYNKWVEKTGPRGFYDSPSGIGPVVIPFFDDYSKAMRETNNFWDSMVWALNTHDFNYESRRKLLVVPSGDNDKGMFYQQRFYDFEYYDGDNTYRPETQYNMLPPSIDFGKQGKRYEYTIGKNFINQDIIGFVPVLECQLQIGDKYLVEDFDDQGNSIYSWKTKSELDYFIETIDGVQKTIYKNTFKLGFNPQKGDFIVGEKHEIKNNITPSMGMAGEKGTAIPIKSSDNLSGPLKFKIIGPVNSYWLDGIKMRPIWWMSDGLFYEDYKPILSMVNNIMIEDFKVKFKQGGNWSNSKGEKNVVYASDEIKKYIDKKTGIDMDISTGFTNDERNALNLNSTVYKNTVADVDTGLPILSITNMTTNEEDKPEKLYVDYYFREYSEPKIILETDVKDDVDFTFFNRYNFNYFNNKDFAPMGIDYNLRYNSVKLKLKET